jgi:hypothetical protein
LFSLLLSPFPFPFLLPSLSPLPSSSSLPFHWAGKLGKVTWAFLWLCLSAHVAGRLGPWAPPEGEARVAEPTEEEKAILEMWQKQRKQEAEAAETDTTKKNKEAAEESSILHRTRCSTMRCLSTQCPDPPTDTANTSDAWLLAWQSKTNTTTKAAPGWKRPRRMASRCAVVWARNRAVGLKPIATVTRRPCWCPTVWGGAGALLPAEEACAHLVGGAITDLALAATGVLARHALGCLVAWWQAGTHQGRQCHPLHPQHCPFAPLGGHGWEAEALAGEQRETFAIPTAVSTAAAAAARAPKSAGRCWSVFGR